MKAGIPTPDFFATLDGVFEISCGVLIWVGLLTRPAVLPMVVDMIGALAITKLPILWGHAPLFKREGGWWDFAHESRLDLAQLCSSVLLLLVGAGRYSPDARLNPPPPPTSHLADSPRRHAPTRAARFPGAVGHLSASATGHL